MNIVYATDGSASAVTAGELLATLPLAAGTRVTVLSAIPESSWVSTPPMGGEGSIYPLLAEVAAQEQMTALQTAEAGAAALRERGNAVVVSVRRKSPADAILEQAREVHAGLIVVGSHGMGAIEHFLIGSVSERVARYAPCSVLVARGSTLRRAVVAVDESQSAAHALDALVLLPLPETLEMTVVHVLRPSDGTPPMQLGHGLGWDAVIEQYEEQRQNAGLRIVKHAQERLRAAHRDGPVEADVRCGAPADELVVAAREVNADLIVVGAANKSALGRLFLGSASGRVLSHAPCSVLVARTAHDVEP